MLTNMADGEVSKGTMAEVGTGTEVPISKGPIREEGVTREDLEEVEVDPGTDPELVVPETEAHVAWAREVPGEAAA